ncbi:hypothetical protein [Amycolatopsis sp. NPDC059657]|uniref:hypothetical protein n=1 Tax=Amycolatopsis sp. NPDC059657 TaxID=3346899 RepID=UPI00366A8B27
MHDRTPSRGVFHRLRTFIPVLLIAGSLVGVPAWAAPAFADEPLPSNGYIQSRINGYMNRPGFDGGSIV